MEEEAARPSAVTERQRELPPEPIEAGAAGRKALQARGPEARSRARMQVLIKAKQSPAVALKCSAEDHLKHVYSHQKV